MKAFFSYAIVLSLGLAIGFIVKGPLNLEDIAKFKWLDEITVILNKALVSAKPAADVVPIDPAAAERVDEELDYRIAQRIGSLEGWRSFLAAHGSSAHTQSARAEAKVLADKASVQAAAEVSNGASTDAKAVSDVGPSGSPSPRTEVAAPARVAAEVSNGAPTRATDAGEVGPSGSPSPRTEVAALAAPARVAAEVSNGAPTRATDAGEAAPSVPRSPGTEVADLAAPAQTAAEVSNGAPTDANAASEVEPSVPRSPGTEVAALAPDEICNRDGDRLERLRSSPTSDEAARFANELRCEKLRPQLVGLMASFGNAAPAQAAAPSIPPIKEGSILGPKWRATGPVSRTRRTASSRSLQPRRHANGCAFKSVCFWRASTLPPILLALIGARPKNSSALGHTLIHARPNDLSGR